MPLSLSVCLSPSCSRSAHLYLLSFYSKSRLFLSLPLMCFCPCLSFRLAFFSDQWSAFFSLDQTHPALFSYSVFYYVFPPISFRDTKKGERRKWGCRCGGYTDICMDVLVIQHFQAHGTFLTNVSEREMDIYIFVHPYYVPKTKNK